MPFIHYELLLCHLGQNLSYAPYFRHTTQLKSQLINHTLSSRHTFTILRSRKCSGASAYGGDPITHPISAQSPPPFSSSSPSLSSTVASPPTVPLTLSSNQTTPVHSPIHSSTTAIPTTSKPSPDPTIASTSSTTSTSIHPRSPTRRTRFAAALN